MARRNLKLKRICTKLYTPPTSSKTESRMSATDHYLGPNKDNLLRPHS
jgi:hypothetical protein